MHLETDRLLLRSLQAADIPGLVQLWSDPEVTRSMGGPRGRAHLLETFGEDLRRSPSTANDLWPLFERASSRLVGHCGLLDKEVDGRPETELVYVLARSAWGRGYATEIALALKQYARERLGLRRLVALIDAENSASERVAARVGMRFEREIVRPGGKVMRLYAADLAAPAGAARQKPLAEGPGGSGS